MTGAEDARAPSIADVVAALRDDLRDTRRIIAALTADNKELAARVGRLEAAGEPVKVNWHTITEVQEYLAEHEIYVKRGEVSQYLMDLGYLIKRPDAGYTVTMKAKYTGMLRGGGTSYFVSDKCETLLRAHFKEVMG